MTKSDFKEFGIFMLTIGEMSIGSQRDKEPSDEKIFLYFCALSDMELSNIKKNAMIHFNFSDWFPGVASLRNPLPIKDRAVIDYEIVKQVIQSSHDVNNIRYGDKIKANLAKIGRQDLQEITFHFIDDFSTTKAAIIRAQFVRHYQSYFRNKEINLLNERKQMFLEFKPKSLKE